MVSVLFNVASQLNAFIDSQEPLKVQGGKFEKPQLTKTVKKTTEPPKKAGVEGKYIKDGVNTVSKYEMTLRDVLFYL